MFRHFEEKFFQIPKVVPISVQHVQVVWIQTSSDKEKQPHRLFIDTKFLTKKTTFNGWIGGDRVGGWASARHILKYWSF